MIEILSQSALASVQDLGRFSAFRWGVGTAGAMDGLALICGNVLLGNDDDAAGIEHGAPALGTWENDTLVLQYELTQFGFSRQIYTVAAGEYLLTLQNSREGKEWSTFLEGRYQRIR